MMCWRDAVAELNGPPGAVIKNLRLAFDDYASEGQPALKDVYLSLERVSQVLSDQAQEILRLRAAAAAMERELEALEKRFVRERPPIAYEDHTEACRRQADKDALEGEDPVCVCGAASLGVGLPNLFPF